ncbi:MULTISPECIES: DUF6386 family protein [unclassified Novosphingobium]|uniref:DUF6386 family protein n=1 Tax=unclassified Novosphingobium TaxID=2644732 RepID=UPI00146E3E7D|nr:MULTISPECIES: DUF6386 family protein [unclassified Novosphingobium]NMN07508.1 hypothetical protein [Novosphingobium sp. SG919]NMN89805.1 hypothetical protein [Novosphingobium sp. SG916]
MGILRRLFGRKYIPAPELPNSHDGPVDQGELARPGFYTGTASVVIYDLVSLGHRLHDDVDWWADPKVELDEINQRNVLIAGLTFDGFYDLDITGEDIGAGCYSLHFPSGKVFIGPGEVMTGGGDEPDESCSGIFLNLLPGDYNVGIARSEDRLQVSLIAAAPSDNNVIEPIRI